MTQELDSSFERTPETARHIAYLHEHHADAWSRWNAHAGIAASIEHVWAASNFVATSCSRSPALLDHLIDDASLDRPLQLPDIAQDLAASVTAANEIELMEALRRFRRRHMVRIAWRDIAGWATLDETLRELTALADACIQFAYAKAFAALTARYGVPRGAQSGEPQP